MYTPAPSFFGMRVDCQDKHSLEAKAKIEKALQYSRKRSYVMHLGSRKKCRTSFTAERQLSSNNRPNIFQRQDSIFVVIDLFILKFFIE